jgi:hypothetical protein
MPFGGFAYAPAPVGSAYAKGMWVGDCADGQLTARGAEQHATLGESLRARWISALALVDPTPEAAALSLRSTDIPRTRESAENLVASLLPNGVADTHTNTKKGFVHGGGGPIPLSRRPFVVEDMLGNPGKCPRYQERWHELTRSPRFTFVRSYMYIYLYVCVCVCVCVCIISGNLQQFAKVASAREGARGAAAYAGLDPWHRQRRRLGKKPEYGSLF